jgi:hypothetical protein
MLFSVKVAPPSKKPVYLRFSTYLLDRYCLSLC